jgi:hypothetical protein
MRRARFEDAMLRRAQAKGEQKTSWFTERVIGLGLGSAITLYGLFALWTRRTFLPGIKGGSPTVTGAHGAALAAAYFAGGMFLIFRFYIHERCRSARRRGQVYLIENALLVMLIVALIYVLWQVGTVG